VILRESGSKDSNLKELVKWSNDEQIDFVEKIWMSSEGFE